MLELRKTYIMKHWWKIVGVLLVLYTLIIGMIVPLKPGIPNVSPSNGETGTQIRLSVQGYNTHYEEAKELRAWLKLDQERSLIADKITVQSPTTLEAIFTIPKNLPSDKKVVPLALITDNEVDGASVLPSAVFITQKNIQKEMGEALWKNSPISNLHEYKGMAFPYRNILAETIRNTYFHVSLWFGMFLLLIGSVVYSFRYLWKFRVEDDLRSKSLTGVGVVFGLLGCATGAIWAKHTWGTYWTTDVKLNMAAVAMLIYLAYFVLRGSFQDETKKARIGAVYNIFAFAAMFPLLFVIPRLTDSLHPGNGGNPGLGGEDLDNTLRMIFYPSIIGWTLIGLWMANLLYRTDLLQYRLLEDDY